MDTLDPHALDQSVEARIAGQQRLDRLHMSARLGQGIGAAGIPMLVLKTATGDSSYITEGISFAHLVVACDAFNAAVATGQPPAVSDPVAVRRQRAMAAAAIGDRVRDLVLRDGL